MRKLYVLTFVVALAGCRSANPAKSNSGPEPTSKPASGKPTTGDHPDAPQHSEPGTQPETSETDVPGPRIDEAHRRLEATPGGQIVRKSIDAQGGLEQWFASPVIGFRFDYKSLTGGPKIDTYQVVSNRTAVARHFLVNEAGEYDREGPSFGWSGKEAWSLNLPGEFKVNARFWALTPYYFVGMPFVLADPGITLTQEADETLDGVDCFVVRATFESGVGDAPEDYYVVYFDKKTHFVKGLRYIVTYRGFYKDGKHSPEKLMKYTNRKVMSGISVATNYPTYTWDPETKQHGEKVTDIALHDFVHTYFEPFFDPPEGAKIQDGY